MLSKSYERSDIDRLYGHIFTNEAQTATPMISSRKAAITPASARNAASRRPFTPAA